MFHLQHFYTLDKLMDIKNGGQQDFLFLDHLHSAILNFCWQKKNKKIRWDKYFAKS